MARILIVDDAFFMRTTIRQMVERNGHEVVGEGCNGLEAIKLYKELKPDVVTMDITMPELDGLGGLAGIKEDDPNAKVIMVTALGMEPQIKEAIAKGAASFIVKPFKEDKLIQVIKSIVK